MAKPSTTDQFPQPLTMALRRVRLFKAPGLSPVILDAFTQVTGIPVEMLLAAERQMLRRGSLIPLRALFADSRVPKEDGLLYALQVKHHHQGGPLSDRLQVTQRLELQVKGPRGSVSLDLVVTLGKGPGRAATERQFARVRVSYRVDVAPHQRVFREEFVMSGDRPRPYARVARAA